MKRVKYCWIENSTGFHGAEGETDDNEIDEEWLAEIADKIFTPGNPGNSGWTFYYKVLDEN